MAVSINLEKEDERLAELNSKLDAILFSSDTSSTPPNAAPGNSEMLSRCWRSTGEWLEPPGPIGVIPGAWRGALERLVLLSHT